MNILFTQTESFKVTLVDTGLTTKTAGRLQKIRPYIGNEDFMLTYGDGLSNINIKDLVKYHRGHGKLATVSAVQPEARFGGMELGEINQVITFKEKPKGDGQWINGGYFVLSPGVFDYLGDQADDTMWEEGPLENLSKNGQLMAYKHSGFWKCMDAMRDKIELENLWNNQEAKWKVW